MHVPKDSFPLPRIDQIVDSTAGQGMLSFLDAFSGYHQIPCPRLTRKSIHNATRPLLLQSHAIRSKTWRHLSETDDKIFKPLIGHTVEEVWHEAESFQMRLWRKCWQISGFMVSQRGIEVSPDQVKAVMETPHPRKEGITAPHGQTRRTRAFIARFTDELRPFFLAIRKAGATDGRTAVKTLLKRLNTVLCSPILSNPSQKKNYTCICCIGVGTLPKAPPLFPSPPVVVLTDQPLRNILHKPDLTGRMLQWAIELSEFGIEFQPRLSMKGQVMADFVLEYARRPNQHQESNEKEWWTLRVDGASRSSGSGVGLLLQSQPGTPGASHPAGIPCLYNEAEYEVIFSGLDLALALSVSKLRVYSDSQLVVRQVQKEYEANDARMTRYLTKVRDTLQRFTEMDNRKDRRTENGRAEALAGIAASLPIKEAILLPVHVQTNPSVTETSTCNTIEANQANGQEWTNSITEYLRTDTQGPGASCPFHLIGGHLYKRSFTGPYLRNGQAEATNKTLITALKKILEQAKEKWVEELPGVLWAYQTTPGRPTGNIHSPSHTEWMQSSLPEIGLPTIRTEAAKQDDASEELRRNLDWADEVRESAAIRMADYQQRASAHYIANDSRRRTYHPLDFGSPLQVPLSPQQTRPPALLFALISAAANLPSTSFQLKLPSGGASPPPPPLMQRASIESSRLFASAKYARRASFSPRAVDKLASASSSLSAADLHYFFAETRRPSYNQWSAAAGWNLLQLLFQLRIAKRASRGASRIINRIPPDEALESNSSPDPGPRHF
ncbi:hypothetical protein CK203_088694 [Vitis vinifera]|uniref:RNase H type-1 domain-containing protein n=1 Tax=Vitis vinifera TaxID=29760 RepID=A0A438D475_VITVI|nr:hypothetical protein CK203_088694 [Vitis vinifera]